MVVFEAFRTGLSFDIHVHTNVVHRSQTSLRLRNFGFEIRFGFELWIGTPQRQNLSSTPPPGPAIFDVSSGKYIFDVFKENTNLCNCRFCWCFSLTWRLDPQQTSHPKFFDCKTFLILMNHMFDLGPVRCCDDWICRISRLKDHVMRDVGLNWQLCRQRSVTRFLSDVIRWCSHFHHVNVNYVMTRYFKRRTSEFGQPNMGN